GEGEVAGPTRLDVRVRPASELVDARAARGVRPLAGVARQVEDRPRSAPARAAVGERARARVEEAVLVLRRARVAVVLLAVAQDRLARAAARGVGPVAGPARPLARGLPVAAVAQPPAGAVPRAGPAR